MNKLLVALSLLLLGPVMAGTEEPPICQDPYDGPHICWDYVYAHPEKHFDQRWPNRPKPKSLMTRWVDVYTSEIDFARWKKLMKDNTMSQFGVDMGSLRQIKLGLRSDGVVVWR